MIRRLANTRDDTKKEDFQRIIDRFSQKMKNSGYREDQIRKVMVAGIRGWGAKVKRCQAEGRRLRRTSKDSQGARYRRKLLGKSSWFKKRGGRKKDWYGSKGGRGKEVPKKREPQKTPISTPRSVLFVEQTPGGELAAKLRELFIRLEPTLGFYVKVVEKTGRSLMSQFPLTNLWGGIPCGREEDCITCYQGAEVVPNCTKQSVVYENVCASCIPGAGGKDPIKGEDLDPGKPALYVGETSRSIMERAREHHVAWKGRKGDSHMWKHVELEHKGEEANFIMRVVGSHKTALGRQVSEAVRIRRRGGEGNILNSKAEYTRCHIPRLRVEEEEETTRREEQLELDREQRESRLEEEHREWEKGRMKVKDWERKTTVGAATVVKWGGHKRTEDPGSGEQEKERRKRRRKYSLIEENWGAGDRQGEENRTGELDTITSSRVEEAEGGGQKTPLRNVSDPHRVLTQGKITQYLMGAALEEQPRAEITDDNSCNVISTGEETVGGQAEEILGGQDAEEKEQGSSTNSLDDFKILIPEEMIQEVEDCLDIPTPSMAKTATIQTLGKDDIRGGVSVCENDRTDGGTRSEQTLDVKNDDCMSVYQNDIYIQNDIEETMNDKVMKNMEIADNEERVICQFKRGICTVHNIKGTKVITKSKKWTRRKNDYGWVTSQKTTYTCSRSESLTNLVQPVSDVEVAEGTSPDYLQQQQQGVLLYSGRLEDDVGLRLELETE